MKILKRLWGIIERAVAWVAVILVISIPIGLMTLFLVIGLLGALLPN